MLTCMCILCLFQLYLANWHVEGRKTLLTWWSTGAVQLRFTNHLWLQATSLFIGWQLNKRTCSGWQVSMSCLHCDCTA